MIYFFILAFPIYAQNANSIFTFSNGFKKEFTLLDQNKYLTHNISSSIKRFFGRNANENEKICHWYYVHFLINNISDLMPIFHIDQKNEIIKNTYALFLSKKQLKMISNISLIKKIDPKDKIIEENCLIKETNLFVIMTTFNYELKINDNCFIEKQLSNNSYIIRIDQKNDNKKYQIINELSEIPEVRIIITYKKLKLKNSIGTGFTQKNNNHFEFTPYGYYKIDRYLNENGLKGEGQIVTILDTVLDFYHSMFRDDTVPMEINKYMPNHRKIVFYYSSAKTLEDVQELMDEEAHGTHVSGTVAGKSICPNDIYDMNNFDGNAPESKIIFAQLDELDIGAKFIGGLMNRYNSTISSNSIGSTDYDTTVNFLYGQLALENPQSVFIYASGNEYEKLNGNFSICDPGGSKDVLTVGALDSFYTKDPAVIKIENIESGVSYYLNEISPLGSDDFMFVGKVGIDHDQCDILLINVSQGNKCKDFTKNMTYILFVNDEFDWIYDCDIPQNARIYYSYDENIMNNLLSMNGKFLIQRLFKFDFNNLYTRAIFSSTGPANKGILKPDVMAPGSRIISANSNAHSNKPHGCYEDFSREYIFKDGSSMATPNVAGGMALVHQYFNSGKWIEDVKLDGATSRALIINSCTDPSGSKTPNIMIGHGIVDISTILPIHNEFGVRITHQIPNEKHSVAENGHVITKLKVDKSLSTNKLQITLSYLDPLLDMESPIPITRDLDIIVVSPSKQIFIGDHLESKDTQHTSTNEKIIINEDEIENGEYIIHVYGGVFADNFGAIPNQKQEFSVVATGPIENGYLEFEDNNECPCEKCNPNHPGYCICDETKNIGQICQVQIENFNTSKGTLILKPLEVKRARFSGDKKIISVVSKSPNPGRSSTVWISKKCHLSIGEYEINGGTGKEGDANKTINVGFESNEICVAIFNFNDVESEYHIEVTYDPSDNKKPSKASKIGILIGIIIIPLVIIIIIIIIVVICCKYKKCKCTKKIEQNENELDNTDLIPGE